MADGHVLGVDRSCKSCSPAQSGSRFRGSHERPARRHRGRYWRPCSTCGFGGFIANHSLPAQQRLLHHTLDIGHEHMEFVPNSTAVVYDANVIKATVAMAVARQGGSLGMLIAIFADLDRLSPAVAPGWALHPVLSSSAQSDSPAEHMGSPTPSQSSSPPPTFEQSSAWTPSRTQACRRFRRTGACKYGQDCWFSHRCDAGAVDSDDHHSSDLSCYLTDGAHSPRMLDEALVPPFPFPAPLAAAEEVALSGREVVPEDSPSLCQGVDDCAVAEEVTADSLDQVPATVVNAVQTDVSSAHPTEAAEEAASRVSAADPIEEVLAKTLGDIRATVKAKFEEKMKETESQLAALSEWLQRLEKTQGDESKG